MPQRNQPVGTLIQMKWLLVVMASQLAGCTLSCGMCRSHGYCDTWFGLCQRCPDPPEVIPCEQTVCAGCCDAEEQCRRGDEALACGAGGGQCLACAMGQDCTAHRCVELVDHCPPDAGLATTARLHAELLGPRCGTPCHFLGGPASQYGVLTNPVSTQSWVRKKSWFANERGALKVVDPESPINSSLWLKVSSTTSSGRPGPEGESTGAREPADGSQLTTAEVQLIKAWICGGAVP